MLPFQLANLDEMSLMVKKFYRRKVYVPIDLKDAGCVVLPTITSMTLLVSCFFDGVPGPGLMIISSKYNIKEEVLNQFNGSFKVMFDFFLYDYF
jgi:hypothetical protein